MRIDVFKKAVLRKSSIELDGRKYKINKGAWAAYIPSLGVKILHSVGGNVHCVHKSAPDRLELLEHGRGLRDQNYSVEEWVAAFNKPVMLRAAENFVAARMLNEAGLGPRVRGLVLVADYRASYNRSGGVSSGIVVDNLFDYPPKGEATEEDLMACGVLPDKIRSCIRQQINGYVSDLNSVVGVMPVGRDDEVLMIYQELLRKCAEVSRLGCDSSGASVFSRIKNKILGS